MPSWTAPRTWTDGEVPTDAMLDAHIRDNFLVLKTTRDDFGRILGLTSATCANLDGSNLTGLAIAGASNNFTAGRKNFNAGSATRLILPVGTNKYTGTLGVDAAGVWIDGTGLRWIASDKTTRYSYVGNYVSSPAGARAGSIYVSATELYYIDAAGALRQVVYSGGSYSPHTDTFARPGSGWINTSYLHFIAETGGYERQCHADVNHADHNDHADHGDHGDYSDHADSSAHTDDYGDHGDLTDYGDHMDSPVHVDQINSHTDYTTYHGDHNDHSDAGTGHTDFTNPHVDGSAHSDVASDQRPVTF